MINKLKYAIDCIKKDQTTQALSVLSSLVSDIEKTHFLVHIPRTCAVCKEVLDNQDLYLLNEMDFFTVCKLHRKIAPMYQLNLGLIWTYPEYAEKEYLNIYIKALQENAKDKYNELMQFFETVNFKP